MSDVQFIGGLTFKAPPERAPDFVKAKGGIHREELIATLQGMDGEWINFDVKESKGGKWYAAVDDWRPGERDERAPGKLPKASQPEQSGFEDDDIPF